MTKRTVEDPKALHSNESVHKDKRYQKYRSSHVFPRIAPPALTGDYSSSWITFLQEMKESKKCASILDKLVKVGNLCVFLAIPPSVFFTMMDDEIRALVKTFYGEIEWNEVKDDFSEDFFNTLSAGMMARIQYWETGK